MYKRNKKMFLALMGYLAILPMILIYFILGENSYVQIHDQLDGEVLNYIYQAKYLGIGDTIPEFMNGMTKDSMTLPAPLGVLFYLFLEPFYAFVSMQAFVLTVGFFSMYLLCHKLTLSSEVALIISVLYCYYPFYPTYGLSSIGQPLVILAFLYLYEKKHLAASYLSLLVFASFSSFSLVGFALLGFSLILSLILRKKSFHLFLGFLVLLVSYLAYNMSLISSILLGSEFTTHREEMSLNAMENIWESFQFYLFTGGSYSTVYSTGILIATLLSLCTIPLFNKDERKKHGTILLSGLACIVGLSLCASLWSSPIVVSLRTSIGGMFVYFQFDRFYFLFPLMWILLLAYVLQSFLRLAFRFSSLLKRSICLACIAILCLYQFYQVFQDNNLNKNIRLLLFKDYETITWESFYMEEVFLEIDSLIGNDKSSYSVVSLGLYPSIPLYHGFTSADGYSNNYDLAYKHQFRTIIESELEKDASVQAHFDLWGNRCYFISAEYGFNPMMNKDLNLDFHTLELNIDAMKSMNIKYIFSTGEILSEASKELNLLKGSPFEDETSYYQIWVYEIK